MLLLLIKLQLQKFINLIYLISANKRAGVITLESWRRFREATEEEEGI
jgi:hypothetical protein